MSKWILLGEMCVQLEDIKMFYRGDRDPNETFLSVRQDGPRKPMEKHLFIVLTNETHHGVRDDSGELFEKLRRAKEAV